MMIARRAKPWPAERVRESKMTKSEMAQKLNEVSAWLPGKKVKIDFGDEGAVMLDGVANQVTEIDGPADTTIKVAWADWIAMRDGQLDGMTAFMQGKLRVEGDMSAAMQLQGVLSKLNG
jgi:putative sterol carrier protein